MDKNHVSCLDFYNQSDSQLLWWQALRKEADFYPTKVSIHLDNHNAFTTVTLLHFYIHNHSSARTKKYDVEWARGARLRQNNDNDPYVMNVCYVDHKTATPHSTPQMIAYSFEECLLYYGKLADLVFSHPVVSNMITTRPL